MQVVSAERNPGARSRSASGTYSLGGYHASHTASSGACMSGGADLPHSCKITMKAASWLPFPANGTNGSSRFSGLRAPYVLGEWVRAMGSSESSASTSDNLPETFRPLFWDCEFTDVTWREHRDFVIRRILSDGTWDAIGWLRTRLGDAALRDWIQRHRGRGLNPQQLRFWELVLDLPSDLVDSWLDSQERRLWKERIRR